MNNMRSKALTIFIIICMLLQYHTFAATDDIRYYESSCQWETYNDNPDLFGTLPGLPAGTTPIAKGRPFNYRIWLAKGKVVYGTYMDANPDDGVRVNYKEGTLNTSGTGFYKKEGRDRGEYRYHGFTKDGNLYTNIDFPNDTNTSLLLEEKAWIYKYWDSPYVNSHFPGEPSLTKSSYTNAALNNRTYEEQKTREWINNGLSAFKIRNGVMDAGIDNPAPGQKADGSWDFHNFINVLSAPSARYSGEGRMFRLTSSGGLFYQTFTIDKYAKEHTPVNVSVEILNENDLHFEDFGSTNPSDFDAQTIDVTVRVTAVLRDEGYINDDVKKAVYYTRYDRDSWSITLNGSPVPAQTIQVSENTAKAIVTVPMTKGEVKALAGNQKSFTAVARCQYYDSEFDEGSNQGSASFTIEAIPEPEPLSVSLDVQCIIPNTGFDIVKFPARDNTDMSFLDDREVYINGVPVDDELFFSGNYVFGIDHDGLKRIDVYYTGMDGRRYVYTGWAYIYNTKPNAQFEISGTYKQNRMLAVNDTSNAGNTQTVLDAYPITGYEWEFRSLTGDEDALRMRDISDLYKEFMYKEPGTYEIQLVVRNSLGRVSDPHVFRFEIAPDYAPAVEIDLNNTVISRNETIGTWNYNAVSTDNDMVESNTVELWYDSNNDGAYDQKLNTWNGVNGFPEYTPTRLGRYRFVNTVTESFGEPTLSEFITPDDTVKKTVEREFLVDNLIPMTGLYVQIPIVRPQVDAFFMLDANLNSSKTSYAINSRIEFDNSLRARNILPAVSLWDMHTYTYSQGASTSSHTGSSYPSSSVSYSSGGYSGTLSLTSVSNNQYSRDQGHYESRTESKSVSQDASNTNSVTYQWTGTYWKEISRNENQLPSTRSYSDSQGFSGTLYKGSGHKTGESGSAPSNPRVGQTYTYSSYWSCTYSGTVSRTVQVWVPNIVWYDDYTGYYSGTIYRSVRQPYANPFRATSYKYVIYLSDGNVSELNDLRAVMAGADAKLILIGQESIRNQIAYDHFILNNGSIDQLMQSALDYISLTSPPGEEYTVLAGTDTFTLNVSDFDEENDPIVEQKLQYVQDPGYFDNPTGMESFAAPAYSDTSSWVDTLVNRFNKTGRFTIYRRIRDNPSTDPAFSDYSKYSGIPCLTIYVHRKPVAMAELSWDYASAENMYKTTWIDRSYDPDHQYSRADKGIVERKIMYRRNGGEWSYRIPDKLQYGSYELQYYVKDPEGVWSDPFTLNFTLDYAPPMQFDGKLRTYDSSFSLNSIPASEYLEAFDLRTRYPYNVYLQSALYNGPAALSPVKTINFSSSTGMKTGNDIQWNNYTQQIPGAVPDGNYTFRITACGDGGKTAMKEFPLRVSTPINLSAAINGLSSDATVTAGSDNAFSFTTSKYVSRVALQFKGNTYTSTSGQIILKSSSDAGKTWEMVLNPPVSWFASDETGYADFTAYTPAGKSETVNVNYRAITVKAWDFTITSILDINWRGFYFDLAHPLNGDGERYGYPEKPCTDIKTTAMPINSPGLVPYSRSSVKAGAGIKGTIRISGVPDSAWLIAKYTGSGVQHAADIPLALESGVRYGFEWIIPIETDSRTHIRFDIVMNKGGNTYVSDKWTDTWPSGNTDREVFYVDGKVTDDLEFNQSH